MSNTKALLITGLMFVLAGGAAQADHQPATLGDIVQHADVVFVGTLREMVSYPNEAHTMIATDAVFSDVEIISSRIDSPVADGTVRFSYLGGTVGDTTITVHPSPSLRVGERYLMCAYDPGFLYADPVVGGPSGLFRILRDTAEGVDYVVSSAGHAVTSVKGETVRTSSAVLRAVSNGVPTWELPAPSPFFNTELPEPLDSLSSVQIMEAPGSVSETPITLSRFIHLLRTELSVCPLSRSVLEPTTGGFIREVDGVKVNEPLPAMPFRLSAFSEVYGGDRGSPGGDLSTGVLSPLQGGTLGACGYQSLPLTMQTVPSTWWSWGTIGSCIASWNVAMPIYRVIPSDGTWDNNSQNEIGGWIPEDILNREFNFSPPFRWAGAIAVTVTFGGDNCTRITQSDIFFNPNLQWTNDWEVAWGSNIILFRPTLMHELGHTWGEQMGIYPETYNYDFPSVMHAYVSGGIVELGHGIHMADAYLLRRIYESQTPIPKSWRDFGIESYHANAGLRNAVTDRVTYAPGDPITISGMTIENIGYSPESQIKVIFCLSSDRQLSNNDPAIGSGLLWKTFSGESFSSFNYSSVLPLAVPNGQYYILAKLVLPFQESQANNATWLAQRIQILNNPPRSFSAVSPREGDTVRAHEVTLSWQASSDPDAGDVLSYEVQVARTSPTNWQTAARGLQGTSYRLSSLVERSTYFWRVTCTDNHGATYTCAARSFVAADITPPTFEVVVVPSTVLERSIGVYGATSETLRDNPSLEIGSIRSTGEGVPDHDLQLYYGSSVIPRSGQFVARYCGIDLWGNKGCGEAAFSAAFGHPGQPVALMAYGGKVHISIGTFEAESECLVVCREGTGDVESRPTGSPKTGSGTVVATFDLVANRAAIAQQGILEIDPSLWRSLGVKDDDIILARVTESGEQQLPLRWSDHGTAVAELNGFGCYAVRAVAGEGSLTPAVLPTSPQLAQNYPNPFNPATAIRFELPRAAHVRLEVFDVLGRSVTVLQDAVLPPGWHEVFWNGTTRDGGACASGVYLYRLSSDGTESTRKMLLLK